LANIFNFGDKYSDNIWNRITNPFWSNVIKYYNLFDKNYSLRSKQEVEATRFMYNSNIKIGKSVIKNHKLISSNIFAIYQLRSNDSFLTLQELNMKLNTPLNFLEYNSIIHSVKTYINNFPHLKPFKHVILSPALNKIMITEKGSSLIYHEMINIEKEITGHIRWSKGNEMLRGDWEHCFDLLKNTTHDTKLRWLQFRILHYILTTNRSVSKYKIGQDSKCSFCGAHSETIQHLLWKCIHVQCFYSVQSPGYDEKGHRSLSGTQAIAFDWLL